LIIKADKNKDPRRYNILTASEIAIIIVSDRENTFSNRDIVLLTNEGPLRRISELHKSYLPLQYPLLFPYGEDGWYPEIPISNINSKGIRENNINTRSKTISQRQYFAYRLQWRPLFPHALHHAGRLFQQFIVDAYATIEQNRLNWIRQNQSKICAELYQ
ncbi:16022_t:CDS:1, partial [Cetraspora pellucida]